MLKVKGVYAGTELGGVPHIMANKIMLTKHIFKLLYQLEILTQF